MFKEVIGLLSFIFMLIVSWCFINSKDDDLLVCVKKILRLQKPSEDDDDGVPDDVEDTPDSTKKCDFEGEDIFNGRIHLKEDGTLITSQPNMTCADCTKYIYKDADGMCYKFVHDPEYNADNYCMEDQSLCNDVCTAQFMSVKCPF